MRRSDREVTDLTEISEILNRCKVCRIAINDREYPYIVPVNFGFEIIEHTILIYIHGATSGKKHDLIRKNHSVSFEMDFVHNLIPPTSSECCSASMSYESVIGQGEIFPLSGERKIHALSIIANHYQIDATHFGSAQLSNTMVYCIKCNCYTGKRRR